MGFALWRGACTTQGRRVVLVSNRSVGMAGRLTHFILWLPYFLIVLLLYQFTYSIWYSVFIGCKLKVLWRKFSQWFASSLLMKLFEWNGRRLSLSRLRISYLSVFGGTFLLSPVGCWNFEHVCKTWKETLLFVYFFDWRDSFLRTFSNLVTFSILMKELCDCHCQNQHNLV